MIRKSSNLGCVGCLVRHGKPWGGMGVMAYQNSEAWIKRADYGIKECTVLNTMCLMACITQIPKHESLYTIQLYVYRSDIFKLWDISTSMLSYLQFISTGAFSLVTCCRDMICSWKLFFFFIRDNFLLYVLNRYFSRFQISLSQNVPSIPGRWLSTQAGSTNWTYVS